MNDSRTPGPRLSLLAIAGALLAVSGFALLLGAGPLWVTMGALTGGILGLGVGHAIHGIYSKRKVGLAMGWGALAGGGVFWLFAILGVDAAEGWGIPLFALAILFSMAGAITGWWRNPNPDRPRFGRW